MVILAVCGSRTYTNYNQLKIEISSRWSDHNIRRIYVGGKGTRYPNVPQDGAAKLGKKFADEFQIECIVVEPDWDTYGKRAGPMHVADIIAPADHMIAFWNGHSPGTKGEIDYAKKHNVPHTIIRF